MTDPLSLFAPELVQAMERLVDERVEAALAELALERQPVAVGR